MGSIDDLLGKKAIVTVETKKGKAPKITDFSLNLGAKKDVVKISNETKPIKNEQTVSENLYSDNNSLNPFASLADALDDLDLKNSCSDAATDVENVKFKKQENQQFQNPTLTDVEKFVFDEQPDQSTEEITDLFSSMIDDLSLATGDQVPTNVARCLKFIKEHAFLADILKPEAIGVLVNGLRRSYGYIVKAKTVKGEKKKARDQKVSQVLDSLSDLSF